MAGSDLRPIFFNEAGHVLGGDGFGSGSGLAVLEELAPLAFLDLAEHSLAEELAPGASLLFRDLVDPVRHFRREGEGDGAGGSGHVHVMLLGHARIV